MIDEREAHTLVRGLIDRVGVEEAMPVLRDAGHRTGDYLLAHRIPAPAQWVIRHLPRRLGLRLLLGALIAPGMT
jgi:divinyl protochlorophyllide a 8-vinyl-reductase